jgi:biotin operon repressor
VLALAVIIALAWVLRVIGTVRDRQKAPKLTQLQHKVMMELKLVDGQPLPFKRLQAQLGCTQIEIEHAIERLTEVGYVTPIYVDAGDFCSLDSKGMTYVLAQR